MPADASLYRRPLPTEAVAFSSTEGRALFAEALAAGEMDGYFPLAEQFHTQSDPAFCGLGSLVVALNTLAIDPGRLWKGPWRWFDEELLDCCVPLSVVRSRGISLDELACLARCNGAEVQVVRADAATLDDFRAALVQATKQGSVLIASYDRAAVAQTGSGHFSPIGGYHAARDLALVLDVARFKYPPHWVSAAQLFAAMQTIDPVTGRARGWAILRSRAGGLALGFSVRCEGDSWQSWATQVAGAMRALGDDADVASLARAMAPLASHVDLRLPANEVQREALDAVRAELRASLAYTAIEAAIGSEAADLTLVALLACVELLLPEQRRTLEASLGEKPFGAVLAAEIASLRAQVGALRGVAGA